MMTTVKKNYASMQAVQEGVVIPPGSTALRSDTSGSSDKRLDIKGIPVLTKSTSSESTREALQKILLEDIMKAPAIDQLRFVKDIAILEARMRQSVENGSKEYFRPAVVKAMSAYAAPDRIQGIKASIVWNKLKPNDGTPILNLEERNAIDIAKVVINKSTLENIKDQYPEVYNNGLELLEMKEFKDKDVDCIAIPIDVQTPSWLLPLIDMHEIIDSNITNFPFESIGIKRMGKDTMNYTNIVQL